MTLLEQVQTIEDELKADYYTRAEAMAVWGITIGGFWKLLKRQGEALGAIKVNGQWHIPKERVHNHKILKRTQNAVSLATERQILSILEKHGPLRAKEI